MDDVMLLKECVKVEKIKEELCDRFQNAESAMLEEANAPVAVLLQPKVEVEETVEQETKPITTVYLFPVEEEQLEDPLAVDPLAGCEKWNEKKPLAESFLLRVKKKEAAETEKKTGTSNERSEQAALEEMEDDRGSDTADSPSEENSVLTLTIRQPFACAHCSETYRDKKTLKEHSRKHREDTQLLACEMCQKQFTSQRALWGRIKVHRSKAGKRRNFPCEICGKVFKERGHLKRHVRIHTGEKPFVCNNCRKEFTGKSKLEVHLTKHTEEWPYSCSICNKRFAQKGNLLMHTKRHLNIRPLSARSVGGHLWRAVSTRCSSASMLGKDPMNAASADLCTKGATQQSHSRSYWRNTVQVQCL